MTIPLTALILLSLAALPDSPASLTGEARDPFRGPSDPSSVTDVPCEGGGLSCVSWQRVKVTMVVTSPAGDVATLQGPGGESWFAREGDRLRNALVVRIDPERRGVLLREPMPGTVAGFREIVLVNGEELPIIREPRAIDPALAVTPAK